MSGDVESSGDIFGKIEFAHSFRGIDIIEGQLIKIKLVLNRCRLLVGVVDGVG